MTIATRLLFRQRLLLQNSPKHPKEYALLTGRLVDALKVTNAISNIKIILIEDPKLQKEKENPDRRLAMLRLEVKEAEKEKDLSANFICKVNVTKVTLAYFIILLHAPTLQKGHVSTERNADFFIEEH